MLSFISTTTAGTLFLRSYFQMMFVSDLAKVLIIVPGECCTGKNLFVSREFCLMFFGHSHSMWKFPGPGSNLCHSSGPSLSSDNTGSSTSRPPGNS